MLVCAGLYVNNESHQVSCFLLVSSIQSVLYSSHGEVLAKTLRKDVLFQPRVYKENIPALLDASQDLNAKG